MKALKILGALAAAAVMTFSVAVTANAAPTEDPQGEDLQTEDVTFFSVEATASQESYFSDETVRVDVKVTGDPNGVEYKYTIVTIDGEIVESRTSKNNFMVTVLPAGRYAVKVEAENGSDMWAMTSTGFVVVDREPLSDDGSALSSYSVDPGDKITINAAFKGGKAPYTYSYSYTNRYTGSTGSSDFISKTSYTYSMPKAAGYFLFSVTAKDSLGNTETVNFDAAVVKQTDSAFSLNGSKVSAASIAPGEKITTTAAASGGTAPYSYHISYMGSDGKWFYLDRDYIYGITRSFTLPQKSGRYVVRIGAKDYTGKYIEKRFNVDVLPFTVAASTVNKTVVNTNEAVTMTAVPSNNVGAVKYHYSYHLEGKPWTYLGDYISATTKQVKFASPGTYYVRVGAKDSLGTYKEKQFKITVKSPQLLDVSASTASASLVQIGTKIRLTSKVSNSSGTVKYHYSYHAEGKPWTYLGDYITSSTKDFTFNWPNVYYIRVGVKDDTGVYKEKQFKVNVFNKAVKTINKATTLQSGANWKSGSVLILSAGTKVNLIRNYGVWDLVRYNSSTGYVYNLAYGAVTRNYSAITTSTLPTVADDIIFAYGKNIRPLFDYVNSMSYAALNNDTLENLCVHILKYRRGACYHRAALLYYLLDRAGFEVVRVYDGIDNYTGGDPHNWCIVKTNYGWRHIDPTPIRGLSQLYLVKDSDISGLFTWNRSKYPACI